MADLAKIKRNVGRMVGQNAPEADIDEYIRGEGVSLDQVRNFKGAAASVSDEATRRLAQDPGGGLGLRLADNLSLGAFTPVSAAAKAGVRQVGRVLTGQETDYTDAYKRERDTQDEMMRRSREDAGWLGVGTELGLSLPFMAGQAGTQAAGQARNALSRWVLDPAKAGAAYGAAYGFNSARGGVGEHIENTATHGLTGAVLGPVLNAGMSAVGSIPAAASRTYGWMTGRTPPQVETATNRLADFAAANVRPFGPAVSDSRTGDFAARGLARSMVGGDLRRAAGGAIDDVTASAQRALNERTGGVPVNDLGSEIQGTLTRNLAEHSRPSAEVRGMPAESLTEITGAAPRPVAEPIPAASVRDVAPAPVDPKTLNYRKFAAERVERPAHEDISGRVPRIDEVPIPADLTAELRQTYGRANAVNEKMQMLRRGEWQPEGQPTRRYAPQETVEVYRRVYPDGQHPDARLLGEYDRAQAALEKARRDMAMLRPPAPTGVGGPGYSPEQMAAYRSAENQFLQARALTSQISGEIEQNANRLFRGNPEAADHVVRGYSEAKTQLDDILSRSRVAQQAEHQRVTQEAYQSEAQRVDADYRTRLEAAQKAADEQTEAARQAAMREADAKAQQEALQKTQTARAKAEQAARDETARRQADLDARWQADNRDLRVFRPGQSQESYPTEFSAAYEQLNRQTPSFRQNVLGRRPVRGQAERPDDYTATRRLVDELGVEARGRMENPGYREGQPFGADDAAPISDQLGGYLERTLGADIAGRLRTLADRRSKDQFAPGPQGLRDLMTAVRRARQDAERQGTSPLYPGSPMPERAAALRRLEGAMREDYHTFLRQTGAGGEALSDAVRNVDRQYAQHLEEVRKPLATLFGRNVEPMQAMDRIVKAAQDGNLDLVRPFVRVMTEKGNPGKAAAAVVTHATQGAATFDDFLRGYRSISPEVRSALFVGQEAQALRSQLDRLERIGTRLEPYSRAIERAATHGEGIRIGHFPLAGALYYHFWPTIAAYGSGALASRFMASPRYVAWLTRAFDMRSAGALNTHIDRLAFVAGRDADMRKAMEGFSGELKKAIVSPANATFIGEGAQGPERAELDMAKAATAAGQDERTTWKEHGWMPGKGDGKWRGEVDDSGSTLTETATGLIGRPLAAPVKTTIGGLIKHDPLFKAYPELADIPVQINPMTQTYGAFQPIPGTMLIGPKALASAKDLRGTIIHELQHAIQQREKFAYGRLGDDAGYLNRPGEAEAYNTEARMDYGAAARRFSFPDDSMPQDSKPVNYLDNALMPGRRRHPPAPGNISRMPAQKIGGLGQAPSATPDPTELDKMADMVGKAATSRGLDLGKASPQEVIDTAWDASPSDAMADAIEQMAKRHGLKLPWDK